jgi:phosphatidylserine decarboxylase
MELMRIPLTKYGMPQVLLFPGAILIIMLICGFCPLGRWLMVACQVILLLILIWSLAFFRDPKRVVPADKNLLIAPADGKITDIEITGENALQGREMLRIGIFLSVFNVHINRAPCDCTVEAVNYKKGKFKDARDPDSARVNEANELILSRGGDKLLLRQISGAIARRIVCKAIPGQDLAAGEKFGMIKFGSRTELYLPNSEYINCMVKVGDKVKAGLSPLIKYENG